MSADDEGVRARLVREVKTWPGEFRDRFFDERDDRVHLEGFREAERIFLSVLDERIRGLDLRLERGELPTDEQKILGALRRLRKEVSESLDAHLNPGQ